MTILIMPTERCNFRCLYCFEPDSVRQPRDPLELDIGAMERSLQKLWKSEYGGSSVGIHGGECTTLPPRELEEVFKMVMRVTECNNVSITTNAYNINDFYIRLFKKYNTHVGISMDGPEELNLLRGPNPLSESATLGYNRKLKKTIRKLKKEGIGMSGMVILHKANAGDDEKLDKLMEWVLWLSDMGIKGGRMNGMYAGSEHLMEYQLTPDELTHAWIRLFDFTIDNQLRWNPFREMVDNLLGFALSPCVYAQCDFFKTLTISILPDGTISNCDRTFSDELHVRSESKMKSGRYAALGQTECLDCKYWNICHGACPCEGIDNDWRSKSRFCDSIYGLYDHIGYRLKSLLPNIRLATENNGGEPFKLMSYNFSTKPSTYGAAPLRQNQPPPLAPPSLQGMQLLPDPNHGDQPHGDGHGDKPHGDKPHGDSDVI